MRFKRAGRRQRLECLDEDDVATLHVDDARAACVRVVDLLELLKRTVGFEHGIEMPDEEDLRPRAGVFRDEVPGALERRAVHPLRLETERIQLLPEDLSDLTDALDGSACRC